MKLDRTLTATVYIVNNDKVLLHMHKKFNSLFPVGGHMESHELPHETAIREALEESGLNVTLYDNEFKMQLGRVIQLPRPIDVLLENVGHEKENIDFIYFAYSDEFKVKPSSGESKEFYGLTKTDIEQNNDIKPHIREMALKALNILAENHE